MNLKIPEKDRDKFARLVAIESKELDSLYAALRSASPQISRSKVVDETVRHVSIDRVIVADVIDLLLTLYRVRADQDLQPTEMAEQLAVAAQESTDERLKTPLVDWENLKPRLARLLDLESFGVSAKAFFIRYEYPNHFHSARILTDARPLFADDATAGPAAFLINHTLHFELSASGQEEDFFLSLNSENLVKLREMIDRALAKDVSLHATLSKTALPILDAEGT